MGFVFPSGASSFEYGSSFPFELFSFGCSRRGWIKARLNLKTERTINVRKIFLFIVVILAVSVVSIVQGSGQDQTVYFCADKNSGDLRWVPGPGRCSSSEISLSWNAKGSQGPQIPAGPSGVAAVGVQGGQETSASQSWWQKSDRDIRLYGDGSGP